MNEFIKKKTAQAVPVIFTTFFLLNVLSHLTLLPFCTKWCIYPTSHLSNILKISSFLLFLLVIVSNHSPNPITSISIVITLRPIPFPSSVIVQDLRSSPELLQ